MGEAKAVGERRTGLGTSGRRALWLGLLGYVLFWGSLLTQGDKALFAHPGDFAPGTLGFAALIASACAVILSFDGFQEDGRGERSLRMATAAFALPPAACVLGAAGVWPALLLAPLGVLAAPILALVAAIRGARPRWAILLVALPAILGIVVVATWWLFVYSLVRAGGP